MSDKTAAVLPHVPPARWVTMFKGPKGWHFAVLETDEKYQHRIIEKSPALDRFSAADLLTTYVEDQILPTEG